ncbi:MAG TPA: hypothetical protein VFC51_03825 [Chloroflexota bacterium]|nr:hypothetical protein [Chloroflexota bacterium]
MKPPTAVTLLLLAAAGTVACMLRFAPGAMATTIAVIAFFSAGPGLAVVRLLAIRDLVEALTLMFGVSLAADVIVAEAFVQAGAWSGNAAAVVLLALTVVLAALPPFPRDPSRGAPE